MLPVDRARAEVPTMASPGDETAAGAERHALARASAADREQVIEVLKVAFVQDRITKDELDQRIGKASRRRPRRPGHPHRRYPRRPDQGPASRTRTTRCQQDEADPAHERRCSGHRLRDRRSGGAFAPSNPVAGVIAGLMAGAFTAGLLAVLLTLIAWAIDRSAGRQPPQGPPPGVLDNAAQHSAPADPARQSRQSSRRPRPGASAAQSRLPRSPVAGLRSPQRWRSLTTLT